MVCAVKRLEKFSDWLKCLRDVLTRQRLNKRLSNVQLGNLGEGVYEMREQFGTGWRMYYDQRAGVPIVMLGGGDKSTQHADIDRAIEIAKSLD